MKSTNSFVATPENKEGVFSPGGPTPTFNPPPSADSAGGQETGGSTTEYHLNHLAIRITDPARSLHFYVDLLGMRVIFTFNAGPFTIYYLGHPPPGIQPADLASWAQETSQIPVLTRTKGLLELYHVHGTEQVSNGNVPPHLGFAHLGFSVPDVRDAVSRLKEAGVTIVKDVGEFEREHVPLSTWEEDRGVGQGGIHENYAAFLHKFAIVADPVSEASMRVSPSLFPPFPSEDGVGSVLLQVRGKSLTQRQDGYWLELIPQTME